MTTTTLPSGTGIVSTYTYDNADRLTNIAHVKGGSTTVASVAYTLDDVGNRTQRVDQQGTHTYAYDDLHRLTSVTYPGPSTTTYDFDEFGNRIEMVVGAASTTYAYDRANGKPDRKVFCEAVNEILNTGPINSVKEAVENVAQGLIGNVGCKVVADSRRHNGSLFGLSSA